MEVEGNVIDEKEAISEDEVHANLRVNVMSEVDRVKAVAFIGCAAGNERFSIHVEGMDFDLAAHIMGQLKANLVQRVTTYKDAEVNFDKIFKAAYTLCMKDFKRPDE